MVTKPIVNATLGWVAIKCFFYEHFATNTPAPKKLVKPMEHEEP